MIHIWALLLYNYEIVAIIGGMMKKNESEITNLINKLKNDELDFDDELDTEKEISAKLENLMVHDFGKRSLEFLQFVQPLTKVFPYSRYKLWLKIETYLHYVNTENADSVTIHGKIKDKLEKIKSETYKSDGTGLLPSLLSDGMLVRSVYRFGNPQLIKLFTTYLPIPDAHVFKSVKLPPIIQAIKNSRIEVITKFVNKNKDNLTEAMDLVRMVQRKARGLQRLDEETQRIKNGFNKDIYNWTKKLTWDDKTTRDAIKNANRPYESIHGDEHATLAFRIRKASKNVKLFSSVKHIAATDAITNILDEGLRGQRELREKYKSYRRAAQHSTDTDNGDGNVICLGPYKIDPLCMKPRTTEITFDLYRITEDYKFRPNPCIFFKQQDFGFDDETKRTVKFGSGGKTLSFNHTSHRLYRENHKTLKLFDDKSNISSYSQLPQHELIAYDLEKIHQLLCLNFFKHLDNSKVFAEE